MNVAPNGGVSCPGWRGKSRNTSLQHEECHGICSLVCGRPCLARWHRPSFGLRFFHRSRRGQGNSERVVRPDAGAVQGIRRCFRQALEGDDRRECDGPFVARWIGQAGPQRDRRFAGLGGYLGLGLRHRCHCREGLAGQGLADRPQETAQQQQPVHFDDSLPGSQGQSQGHSRLGRPGQAGGRDHYAASQDIGRRPLELPGRLGIRAASRIGRSRQAPRSQAGRGGRGGPEEGEGVCPRPLSAREDPRFRCSRRHDYLRAEEPGRRADRLGERGLAGDARERRGEVRRGHAEHQHPGGTARGRGR